MSDIPSQRIHAKVVDWKQEAAKQLVKAYAEAGIPVHPSILRLAGYLPLRDKQPGPLIDRGVSRRGPRP